MSIDSATAPISSEAVSEENTWAPAAAWNTTKAMSLRQQQRKHWPLPPGQLHRRRQTVNSEQFQV
jgi:hypothetical protein